MALYVAATLLLLCQCFAGKRTRSEIDKVSKESCEGMRELLLPCACILSRVMHLVVCSGMLLPHCYCYVNVLQESEQDLR